MNFGAEVKFTGDSYHGFYSCGMTMLSSGTMESFKNINEVSKDGKTITEYSTDDGIILRVERRIVEATGAEEIVTSIVNNSESEVTMELLTSFLIKGVKADRIHRIQSFWSAEGRHRVDTVNDLNMECSWNHMAVRVEKFGNVGSMPVRKYFPFLALEDSEAGKFTAVSLYSPASWQMEIICEHEDTLNIAGGIADRDFGHWTKKLLPKETFIAPKAVAAEGASLEEVCDKLVKSQHPDISHVDDKMGITFNEYCTTWGNPTHENIAKICDKLEDVGIQYLVMDSGWFGKDGNWWESEGDWYINKKRFPDGLKKTADYIRSKGMVPGIWFEFEVAGYGSDTFKKDDWMLKKDGVSLNVGGRKFLDMENKEVQEYLDKSVIGLLKDNGYGYIKVDYNDTIGIGVDGPDGPGENLRRKIAATQAFFKKMRAEIPELVIENCSSGGHRLEPSMMELASQASFSDAHEIKSLPIIAANLHRVIRPEQSQIWAVLRKEDDSARLYYSLCATLFGRMGLSGDIYDLSESQWKTVKDGIAFYKQVSDIIKNGFTSAICCDACSYNKPLGGQLAVREYDGKALIVYHRFEKSTSVEEFAEQNSVSFRPDKCLATYGLADRDFSAQAWLMTL